MVDLSGPYLIKPRMGARQLRSQSSKIKVWLLHTVCLTSYLNSIAPLEEYVAPAFIDGFHRIGCRLTYPSIVYMDCSFAQLKALVDGEFTMFGLQYEIFNQSGIDLRLSACGNPSHSRDGRIYLLPGRLFSELYAAGNQA